MTKTFRTVVFAVAILAQAAVPGWMLAKHHLILTRGERVSLPVTIGDPRDLFMGHYARLSVVGDLPPLLEGVPKGYLRYYCDQRYAKRFDRTYIPYRGELTVRVWRGSALAEALTIDGKPAHVFLEQTGVAAREKEDGLLRLVALDDIPDPLFEEREDFAAVTGIDPLWDARGIVPPLTPEDWWRAKRGPLPGDPPMSPPEAARRWDRIFKLMKYFAQATPICLPIFNRLPAGLAESFPERAVAYYEAIREAHWRIGNRETSLFFVGDAGEMPPRQVLDAMRKVFPEARWLLPAATLPKGLDSDGVVLLLDAPPAKDPGAPWMLRGPAPSGWEPPKGCVGFLERRDPLGDVAPPVPGEAARLVARLRAMGEEGVTHSALMACVDALFREAVARGDGALADRALLLDDRRTLHTLFEHCVSYAEYRALVARLAERERAGRRVLLGGWPTVAPLAADPPPPPRSKFCTVRAVLELAEALGFGPDAGE